MQKSLLFIPGPVTVAEPVLAAMAQPMIDHRGAAFAALIERVVTRLRPIFGTNGSIAILGASGSGGLEAAVANMFSPGEKILACPVGVFGERILDIAKTFGMDVEILPTTWGHALDPAKLAARLAADTKHEIKGVLLTHNETSTGVQNDMAALSAAFGSHPAARIVDSVSGMGATEFKMDAWGYDVVVTASQKVLACPPGIAMVAVSERAWGIMAQAKASRYYFDLKKAHDFGTQGQTPWTPPVSILYALDVALKLYADEGPANVWARHDRYARAIRAAAQALGIELFAAPDAYSVTVVAMKAPAGIDVAGLRKRLNESRGIVMGGGQKELKGKILRMGTMGDLSQTDVLGALGALEIALLEDGFKLPIGAGVRAALSIFLDETATPGADRRTAIPAAV